MKKTTLICQGCKTEILRVKSCEDLSITCPECGQQILLNVQSEVAMIKSRPPKKQATAP